MRTYVRNGVWTVMFLSAATTIGSLQAQPPNGPGLKMPAILTAKPIQPGPKDDDLQALLKTRYNEAVAEMSIRYLGLDTGRTTIDTLLDVGQRVLHSGLDLYPQAPERVALLTQYLELAKSIETLAQQRFDLGVGPKAEVHRARYFRVDGQVLLLRAERAAAAK